MALASTRLRAWLRGALRALRPSRPLAWFAALALVVLPALWVKEISPGLAAPIRVASARGETVVPRYLPGDCLFYRTAIVSLLTDGDLDLRNNADWTVLAAPSNVAVARDGAWVPKHSILLPILALPLFAIGGDPGLLAFNLLQVLCLDALVLWLALRFVRPGVAFATALLFALTTLLRPLALNFSSDVLSTALVTGAVIAVLDRRALLAGALLGLAMAAKWSNAMFVAPLGLAVLTSCGLRGGVRFGMAAMPPLVALAVLNWHWFGSPLVTPYDRVFSNPGEIPISYAFDAPFWSGLWSQLTDRRLGLVVSAPPVLIAIPGFVFLWRRARGDALLLASCTVLQIAVFAPYRYWSMSVTGHRFLLTAIVLCAPAAAVELERVLDAWCARTRAAAPVGGASADGRLQAAPPP
jgi:hypothetical protein